MLSIEYDAAGAKKRLKKRRDAIDKAHVQALNRTASGIKTYTGSSKGPVKAELNIKTSAIRRHMTVLKATKTGRVAKVRIAGRPVPIIEVAARQTKKGVSVKVKGQGARKLLKGAFIATMDSGHTGVFIRKHKTRLPIYEVFTTTVTQALRGHGVAKLIYREVGRRYQKEYRAAKKFQMSKIK